MKFTMFLHIYNSKLLPIKLLVNTMKELGINIEAVNDETMSKKLIEILNDNFKKEILSGIIHDIDSKKRLIYTSNIRVSYDFSEKYLDCTLYFVVKNIWFGFKFKLEAKSLLAFRAIFVI